MLPPIAGYQRSDGSAPIARRDEAGRVEVAPRDDRHDADDLGGGREARGSGVATGDLDGLDHEVDRVARAAVAVEELSDPDDHGLRGSSFRRE